MNHAFPRRAILTWLFLVTATLCSGWLAEHHGLAGHWTAAAVMIVASIKVRLVIIYFMEMGHAPWRWRLAFEAWAVLFPSLILVIYFLPLPR